MAGDRELALRIRADTHNQIETACAPCHDDFHSQAYFGSAHHAP